MNQNQQQDTTGDELPVALIDEGCAEHVRTISSQQISKLSGGAFIGIHDLLSATIVQPSTKSPNAPFLDIGCGVAILNCLETPLTLAEAYYKHGHQTCYPAISDLVTAKTGIKVHEIPAARPDPLNPGQMLYGLGMYGFASDGAGCAGALAFSYKAKGAGPFIGIAYRWGMVFYGDQVGMSADLSAKYGSSLQSFYDATADDTEVTSDASTGVTVSGVMPQNMYTHDADFQMDNIGKVVTVWVRKS